MKSLNVDIQTHMFLVFFTSAKRQLYTFVTCVYTISQLAYAIVTVQSELLENRTIRSDINRHDLLGQELNFSLSMVIEINLHDTELLNNCLHDEVKRSSILKDMMEVH